MRQSGITRRPAIRLGGSRWLAPQLAARDPRAGGERGGFDPDDAGVDFAGRGEAGEAATGAGDDVLPADRAGDALGDKPAPASPTIQEDPRQPNPLSLAGAVRRRRLGGEAVAEAEATPQGGLGQRRRGRPPRQ
jgi:hypothetical protein